MDGLCLKTGVHGLSASISLGGGLEGRTTHPAKVSALGHSGGGASSTNANANGICSENSASTTAPHKASSSRFSFTHPLRSLWPGGRRRRGGVALDDAVVHVEDGEKAEEALGVEGGKNESMEPEERRENWILKILHVRSIWADRGKNGCDGLEKEAQKDDDAANDQSTDFSCSEDDESDLCVVEEDEVQFDRDSFSKLLRRVSLAEAELYAQMSYLGNLAYTIHKIKPLNLLKYHGLRFVTSSLENKKQLDALQEQTSAEVQESGKTSERVMEAAEQKKGYRISASDAYNIAAAAASYLHSRTRSILPFKSSKAEGGENLFEGNNETNDDIDILSSEMASFVATTNSVTAVVAAKEETKQAVAKDLRSAHSSPCEWFICDDDQSGTRFFVIQGSESLASWQANLLFEPIQFEGLDVLVHRGIYEAAKGIYEQMLPEVHAHLQSRGDFATFRFTGHSLGGSLSLLINLMLLIRGEVPLSSLLPVVTFGAPSIMCGGDKLLQKLGLPQSHVQAITMHRDIVPRAFSCNYPHRVAELLRALNGNFRNHPCLENQKLLFAPMGKILILQPDEKYSPHHELLPSGSGLYLLTSPASDIGAAQKQLKAALTTFFNSPHPLEILRDRSAYGSDGTIKRDHDMNSYLRSVRGVIRQELKRIRKEKREQRRKAWWPLLGTGLHTGVIVGRRMFSSNIGQHQLFFSGVVRSGRESFKRFSSLVASRHMHLLVVLLFPVRLLLLGTFNVINSR